MKLSKFIKIYLLLFFISIKAICVIDPDGDKIPSVIPPSPTAASLGKYGEVPVNLYTGTINMSIPLWEINTNQLKASINLSYLSVGVKIAEESGWVGEGWSLIANGVISRTVKGKIDEGEHGYFQYKEFLKIGHYFDDERNYELLKQFADGKIDCEPDIFHFNFGSYSGKFTFANHENKINITPFQNLKIIPKIDSLKISGFTIITPDGTTYIFGGDNGTEITFPYAKYSVNIPYPSSWFLTDIISPNKNDTIHFSYTLNNSTINTLNQTQTCYLHNYSGCSTTPGTCSNIKTSWSIRSVSTCILNSITSRLSKVIFETGERLDISNGKKIDKIKIYNSNDNIETDPPLKIFKFYYDYYGSCDTVSKKRLFLTKLQEYGKNNDSTKNPYIFTYLNPNSLPSRDSKQQDYWGYFNGACFNDTYEILVPEIDYGGFHFNGANRNTNPNKVTYGMLCKIQYPTNGFDTLIFESHNVCSPTWDYNYNSINYNFYASVTFPMSSDTTSFIPQETVMGEIVVTLPASPPYQHSLANAKIINAETGEIINIYNQQADSVNTIYDNLMLGKNIEYKIIVTSLTSQYPENFESSIHVIYDIIDYDSIVSYNDKYIGGVRIKEIQSRDYNDSVLTQKTYSYFDLENPQKSSGNLFSKPRFYNTQKVLHKGNYSFPYYSCYSLLRYSNSIVPMGSSGGSHVGYKYVTEYLGVNGENGKIVYTFSHSSDFFGSSPIGNEWARGKLLKKQIYNNKNILVKELINEYDTKEYQENITKGFIVNYKILNSGIMVHHYGREIFDQNYYNIYSKWKYLKSTATKNYSTINPDDYIQKTKIYNYDFQNQQIKEIKEPQSNGDTIITKYLYPDDYTYSSCISLLENCKNILKTNIQNCVNSFDNCEDEYTQNSFDRGYCYSEWLENLHDYLNCRTWEGYNCDYLLDDANDIFDNCVSNIPNIDYNCIWQLNSCLQNTYYNYNTCENLYDSCVNNKCNSASYLLKPIIKLQKKHISSYIIDEQKINKRNDTEYLIGGKITLYKDYGDSSKNILPYKTLNVNLDEKTSNFSQSYIVNNDFNYDKQYYSNDLTFDKYDEYGNLLQYTPKNDVTISYLWGYNGIYPIAKVNNANYNEISFDTISMERKCPDDAMMTTITYYPSIGIATITDPNGITTYYKYDNYNRLILIKDQDENIIKRINYNYQK